MSSSTIPSNEPLSENDRKPVDPFNPVSIRRHQRYHWAGRALAHFLDDLHRQEFYFSTTSARRAHGVSDQPLTPSSDATVSALAFRFTCWGRREYTAMACKPREYRRRLPDRSRFSTGARF